MAGLAFRAGTVAVRNLSIVCSSSNPWAELVAFQFAESDNKITSARSLGDAHFLWESLPVKWLAYSGLHISDPSAHSKEDTWQANSDKKDEIINTTYRELLFFLFCFVILQSERQKWGTEMPVHWDMNWFIWQRIYRHGGFLKVRGQKLYNNYLCIESKTNYICIY